VVGRNFFPVLFPFRRAGGALFFAAALGAHHHLSLICSRGTLSPFFPSLASSPPGWTGRNPFPRAFKRWSFRQRSEGCSVFRPHPSFPLFLTFAAAARLTSFSFSRGPFFPAVVICLPFTPGPSRLDRTIARCTANFWAPASLSVRSGPVPQVPWTAAPQQTDPDARSFFFALSLRLPLLPRPISTELVCGAPFTRCSVFGCISRRARPVRHRQPPFFPPFAPS